MEVTERDRRSRRRAPLVTAVAIAACLAVAAGLLLARCGPGLVRDDSAEAGFARDMATHHAQAADMALVVRDVTTDERLRTLALDIVLTQTAQRGVFMGWLQQWKLPQASSRPRMAWMGEHDHASSGSHQGDASGHERMMGMATADELARLRGARGVDAEVLFLQLMIRHHEGGVRMAKAILAQSTREEVVAMARSIDESQTAEIALMIEMLAERKASSETAHVPQQSKSLSRGGGVLVAALRGIEQTWNPAVPETRELVPNRIAAVARRPDCARARLPGFARARPRPPRGTRGWRGPPAVQNPMPASVDRRRRRGRTTPASTNAAADRRAGAFHAWLRHEREPQATRIVVVQDGRRLLTRLRERA